MSEITRRRLLLTAPAAPLLIGGPALAEAGEIEKKMHEWIAATAAWPTGVSDKESDAYFESVIAPLQDAIGAMPATTPREMLAKLVVSTRGFDFAAQRDFNVEVMEMLGIEDTLRELNGPNWHGWPENSA